MSKEINQRFIEAIKKGDIAEVAKFLADEQVDPTADKNKTIQYAVEDGNTEIVKLLLEWKGPNGEYLDPNGGPINYAARYGHTELIKTLLQWKGPNGEYVDFNKVIFVIMTSYTDRQDPAKSVSLLLKANTGIYFSTPDAKINENRKAAFAIFPVLFDELVYQIFDKRYADVELPAELQKHVDDLDIKNIAKYHNLTINQLKKIPSSDDETKRFLVLVRSGLIKAEQLPWLASGNKTLPQPEWERNPDPQNQLLRKQRQAFCDTMQACFKLNVELKFKRNGIKPETYTPFLKNLIKSTAAKGFKAWEATAAKLPDELVNNRNNPSGIADAVDDFIKTVFLPIYLQDKKEYDIDEELKTLRPQIIEKFFAGLSIDAICEFSRSWHEPIRTAELNKVKDFDSAACTAWQPLFSGNILPAYEDITATVLTNSNELTKEGKDLRHCVGGYTDKCLRENSHIISLRDKNGTSLSTLELEVVKGKGAEKDPKIINIKNEDNYHLKLVQHHGFKNGSPSQQLLNIEKALFDDIRNGTVKVDLPMLEAQRQERVEIMKNKKDLVVIGYNHKDPDKMQRAVEIYRQQLGFMGVPHKLKENFDVLTGKKQLLEESVSHAARVGRKSEPDPVTAIQKIIDIMHGAGAVTVTIDKSDDKDFGEIVLTPATEELKVSVGAAIGNKGQIIDMDTGGIKIKGLKPRPVYQCLKGSLTHARRLELNPAQQECLAGQDRG